MPHGEGLDQFTSERALAGSPPDTAVAGGLASSSLDVFDAEPGIPATAPVTAGLADRTAVSVWVIPPSDRSKDGHRASVRGEGRAAHAAVEHRSAAGALRGAAQDWSFTANAPRLAEPPTDRLFQSVGRRGPRTFVAPLSFAAIVVVSAAAGHWVGSTSVSMPPLATTGTVEIETNPPGAYVVIDGRPRGRTPLRLTLAAGAHGVELSSEGRTKIVPLRVTAGSHTMQFIELPPVGASEVDAAPGGDALEPGRLD